MKSLALHIEYLLNASDCVTIPGIGALIAEYIPAHFCEQEGLIYPPTRRIIFNSAIRSDDGMLTNSISRAENLNFEQSRKVMREMIADLNHSLNCEGEASLGRIGFLTLSDAGELNFVAYRTAMMRAEDSGYIPARLSSKIVNNAKVAEEAIGKEELNSEIEVSEEFEMRPFSKKNYYLPINKIFAKCAASLVILTVVALSFILPERYYMGNSRIEASMNPVETIVNSIEDKNKLSENTESNMPSASDNLNTTKSTSIAEDENLSNNYLIVATFHNEKEALSFIEERSGGEFPLKAIKGKNVWRIYAGRGDKTTLLTLMKTSEFRSAFSEAWIWTDNG